ncbi:MAG: hypothetical protein HYY93_16360 [Planctomycetes bacterium]|nr:hypothetical protein [Planctomycetota bacterium]
MPAPAGYRTQSDDTSFEAEQVQIAAFRGMSISEKARRLTEMWRAAEQLARAGIRSRHPDSTAEEIRLRMAALRFDRETMVGVFGWDPAVKGY